MSDRLISADKAKEVLKHLLYETAMNNDIDIAEIYEDIIENRLDTWIELIPTVDAVEVVRCKDCKYCDIGSYRGNCNLWDDGYGALVSMDDFCSQGERRKDETDSQEQLSKLQLSKL